MATVTLAGTASSLIKYTDGYIAYVPISMVGYIEAVKTTRISLSCGAYITEWEFTDETERDAALATLLTYF